MAEYRTVEALATVTTNVFNADGTVSTNTYDVVGDGQQVVVVDPYIDIQQTSQGAVITVTDVRGSTQATIFNGKDGKNAKCYSLIPSVNTIIKDKNLPSESQLNVTEVRFRAYAIDDNGYFSPFTPSSIGATINGSGYIPYYSVNNKSSLTVPVDYMADNGYIEASMHINGIGNVSTVLVPVVLNGLNGEVGPRGLDGSFDLTDFFWRDGYLSYTRTDYGKTVTINGNHITIKKLVYNTYGYYSVLGKEFYYNDSFSTETCLEAYDAGAYVTLPKRAYKNSIKFRGAFRGGMYVNVVFFSVNPNTRQVTTLSLTTPSSGERDGYIAYVPNESAVDKMQTFYDNGNMGILVSYPQYGSAGDVEEIVLNVFGKSYHEMILAERITALETDMSEVQGDITDIEGDVSDLQNVIYGGESNIEWDQVGLITAGGVYQSGNGAISEITPYTPGDVVTLASGSSAALFLFGGNTYLGKVAANGTINKAGGDWKYFTVEIALADYICQATGADGYVLDVIPGDGTTLTNDNFEAWANQHVTLNTKGLIEYFYTQMDLNLLDRREAYCSYTVGQPITYTDSTATYCYNRIIPVQEGKTYKISETFGSTLSSENGRVSVICDENNIVRQSISHTPVANSTVVTTVTAAQDGFLVWSIDNQYTLLTIEGEKLTSEITGLELDTKQLADLTIDPSYSIMKKLRTYPDGTLIASGRSLTVSKNVVSGGSISGTNTTYQTINVTGSVMKVRAGNKASFTTYDTDFVSSSLITPVIASANNNTNLHYFLRKVNIVNPTSTTATAGWVYVFTKDSLGNVTRTGFSFSHNDPYGLCDLNSIVGDAPYFAIYVVKTGAAADRNFSLLLDVLLLPTTPLPATEEIGTASKSYSVGDYLIKNNTLCKVTSDIASGSAITVGTNVEQTTVGDELKDVKDSMTQNVSTLQNNIDLKGSVIIDTTPAADVATFSDGLDNLLIRKIKAGIQAIQDLHGKSNPYPAGCGDNKMPAKLSVLKEVNTTGTWSGDSYTTGNITFDILTDDDGNITGIKANGTANATAILQVSNSMVGLFKNGDALRMQGITGGAANAYKMDWFVRYQDSSVTTIVTVHSGNGNVSIDSAIENATESYMRIVVYTGITLTNQMFYPELRLQSDPVTVFTPSSNICKLVGWESVNGKFNNGLYSFVQGGITDATGEENTNNTRIKSEYIPLPSVTEIKIGLASGQESDDVIRRIYYYNSSKTFLSSETLDGSTRTMPYTYTMVIPTGTAYIRFVLQKSVNTDAISPTGKLLYISYKAIPIALLGVGKNKFSIQKFATDYVTSGTSKVGRLTLYLKPNTEYTVSSDFPQGQSYSSCFAWAGDAGAGSPSTGVTGVGTTTSRTITTDSQGRLTVGLYYTDPQSDALMYTKCLDGTYYVQVEEGASATAYEPYIEPVLGGTITINEDGSVDLDVTHEVVDLGDLDWTYSSNVQVMYSTGIASSVVRPSESSIKADIYCTALKPSRADQVIGRASAIGIHTNGNIRAWYTGCSTDGSVFKSAVTGWKLAYPVKNPTSYHLASLEQFYTLPGTNNIWFDCGQTEVDYPCDTKSYIDKRIAAL